MPPVIRGKVKDRGGKPVAQARVYLAGGPQPYSDVAALTDKAGEFALPAPSPGTYVVECTAERAGTARAEVQVGPAPEATVEIKLPGPA